MADEWTSSSADVRAYLARIGHSGSVTVSTETLTTLHRAHKATIPFENIDVVLGRGAPTDIENIQTKLVTRRRGGYCYEHGLLMAAVLEQVGFSVDRLLARVGEEQSYPRARTHLALAVTHGQRRHLVDVGFGAGLLAPLPLDESRAVRQGAWEFRLVQRSDRAYALQEQRGGDWTTLYSFDDDPQHLSDIVMANHFTSTWPRSPFRRGLVVVRRDEESTSQLVGRRFVRSRPGRADEVDELADAAFARQLEHFGLDLSDEELSALTDTLPPPALAAEPDQHEGDAGLVVDRAALPPSKGARS